MKLVAETSTSLSQGDKVTPYARATGKDAAMPDAAESAPRPFKRPLIAYPRCILGSPALVRIQYEQFGAVRTGPNTHTLA